MKGKIKYSKRSIKGSSESIDIDKLAMAIKKVERKLAQKIDMERLEKLITNLEPTNRSCQQVSITYHSGREFISTEQIVYCMADGACTWFFLENGQKLLSSKNLGEYEKVLPKSMDQFQNHFFRIHHSYIINLGYIKRFNRREKYVELKNGSSIAIAQRRGAQFSNTLRKMNLL